MQLEVQEYNKANGKPARLVEASIDGTYNTRGKNKADDMSFFALHVRYRLLLHRQHIMRRRCTARHPNGKPFENYGPGPSNQMETYATAIWARGLFADGKLLGKYVHDADIKAAKAILEAGFILAQEGFTSIPSP